MDAVAENDDVGKALLADRLRTHKESERRWRKMLGISLLLFASMQAAHLGHVVIQNLILSDQGFDWQPEKFAWDPSAGISAEVAATIVVGLAAFVVTINVAVFAARLGSPEDEGTLLDLARWQRRMQNLAPIACYLALAATYTQIVEETALGVCLLFVSVLAVGASDIRIAGRLSALKMEVRSTQKFSDYAEEQYRTLLHSLKPAVRRRATMKNWLWNDANNAAGLLAVAFIAFEASIITALWIIDPVTSYPFEGDPTKSLQALAALWFGLNFTTIPAVIVACYLAAGKLIRTAGLSPTVSGISPVENLAHWVQWPCLVVAVAVPVLTSAILQFGPVSIVLSGAVVLFCFAIEHLLILIAFKTGRGPGMVSVWLAIENRAEDKRLAAKLLDEAKAAHLDAVKRQEALADAAFHQAHRMQTAVADAVGEGPSALRTESMPLLQRILMAAIGNGPLR